MVILTETCHKAFHLENRASTLSGYTMVVCVSCLISASVPCSTIGIQVLPFAQVGHKCYYKREDVKRLLQTKIKKSKTDKPKNNK